MRVTVFGLGHQGAVTAACLAAAGHEVVGLDDDAARVAALAGARPPEREPGLGERLREALAAGRLRLTSTPDDGAARCEVLWLAFDTPLAEDDAPRADLVRARFDALAPRLPPGTLTVVSTQAPVGFVRALEERWAGAGLRFGCVPENLRVGDGVRSFEQAERVVAGVRTAADRQRVEMLFAPLGRRLEWMSPESAEMTKHALNAWLATSVAFANELARLCEPAGADADEVARGLRSDPRVGPRAYLSPGAPFSGGTLARDLRSLAALAAGQGVEAPLAGAVLASNAAHQRWTLE
ncbi:MAG TPA: UDP-glucose/GDP-mannose dehydrogenase family protein, partial [Vicinamibacteria bacterium]|nr:UDP-glucose/GDP-mannose dehydrogenase family protein [Vicinamibacteria bacterium]